MINTKTGKRLQAKADYIKDKALIDAIMNRKIKGLTKFEAKVNLQDAANLVIENQQFGQDKNHNNDKHNS
jgi:hypothetical protein